MEGEACDELWKGGGLGGNKTRVDAFEEAMFKYMEDNVALVNIYMKEPYCEEICQEINLTWYEIIVGRFLSQIYCRISFIANIGGILGLCLGSSFITFMEIFWYLLSPFSKLFRSC